MRLVIPPPIWLLVVIIGLPQLSETVYTPALPDIAHALGVSESWAEYTLTIYLAGFSFGILLWGNLSDRWGRKPTLLAGFLLYTLGCAGCFFSTSLWMLMASRFVQALGGGAGSVLGQSICRDSFHGPARAKSFAAIGGALTFSPAIGPMLGGFIDQTFGWPAIFITLILCGIAVMSIASVWLRETHPTPSKGRVNLLRLAFELFSRKKVVGYALLVAATNGIQFSYFAEGSFYLIKQLGLSPAHYGMSFMALAGAGMFGGWLSHRLHDIFPVAVIMRQGIILIISFNALFAVGTCILGYVGASAWWSIGLTLVSMMATFLGMRFIIPGALAQALEGQTHSVGSASSLFGFFYYMLISISTMVMGMLHNGTLYPMPFYFLGLALLLWFALKVLIEEKEPEIKALS